MKITRKDDGKRGVIEAFEDGVKMGELTYEWISDEKLLINHTQVSEKFKGMGIARKLVIAAIDLAKEKKVKIVPVCWYAEKIFNENQEFEALRG